MKPNSVVITAMIVIGVMQVGAMYFGIDGQFRAYCLGAIAGLAGWAVPTKYLNSLSKLLSDGRGNQKRRKRGKRGRA